MGLPPKSLASHQSRSWHFAISGHRASSIRVCNKFPSKQRTCPLLLVVVAGLTSKHAAYSRTAQAWQLSTTNSSKYSCTYGQSYSWWWCYKRHDFRQCLCFLCPSLCLAQLVNPTMAVVAKQKVTLPALLCTLFQPLRISVSMYPATMKEDGSRRLLMWVSNPLRCHP